MTVQVYSKPNRQFKNPCAGCKEDLNTEDFNTNLCQKCKEEFYKELTAEEKNGLEYTEHVLFGYVTRRMKVKGGL